MVIWLALAIASGARIETLSLTSKVFESSRTIQVLLPNGYDDAKRAYPVLYLNDGPMLFRPLANEGIEVQSLALPPVIVVGIDNGTGRARADELLGRLYPTFVVDELMPAIERKYRVLKGAPNTGIGGFSYGGDGALSTVIAHPNLFGKLLLESTPLLPDATQFKRWPQRVYIGVGTAEPYDADAKSLLAIIRQSPKTRIDFVREEGARHATSFWRKRLPGAVDFLFGDHSKIIEK